MKMPGIKPIVPVFIIFASLVVVACGGSGGDSVAGGGIGGTGVTASGAITGFGSVRLNGLVFDTTNAARIVDGEPADDDTALAVGMVVTVTGTLGSDGVNGTADLIEYDDDVQGPIQEPIVVVDQTKTFSVMGVKVSVNRISTVFENTDYASLLAGDLVEISGFFDADGVLHATRIEDKGGNEVELKGTVNSFGPAAGTFRLDVNYGAIQYLVDYSSIVLPALLAQGDFVEVKGTVAGTTITASGVEPEDEGFDDNIDKASIEGIVTGFATGGIDDFRVAGQDVDASGASFSPAALETGLADGMEVEVEGPVVNGLLQALKVEARGGDFELGARVRSVVPDAGGLGGSITLDYSPGSVVVLVDSQTLLRDDTEVVDPLSLADIVPVNDFLEVEAYLDDSGKLVATEVRRDDREDDLLQGTVDSCDGVILTILGLGFGLDDNVTSYGDESENPVGSALEFCARATVGTLVRIVDEYDDEQFPPIFPDGIADEAELED
jgi:hypothetical protein